MVANLNAVAIAIVPAFEKTQSGMSESVFREKNLKRAAGPEQLDECLKVTGFGAWFVILSAALVLFALFIWIFCARITDAIQGAGYCRDGVITCYFPQRDINEIEVGERLEVGGTVCRITEVNSDLYLDYDIPNEVLFLLPEEKWYCTVVASAKLPDGLYSAQFIRDPITPASFLTKGGEMQ